MDSSIACACSYLYLSRLNNMKRFCEIATGVAWEGGAGGIRLKSLNGRERRLRSPTVGGKQRRVGWRERLDPLQYRRPPVRPCVLGLVLVVKLLSKS